MEVNPFREESPLEDQLTSVKTLEYYIQAPSVFMIQVQGQVSAYQLSSAGFRRSDWRAFVNEIETRFPQRKASYFIGPCLFGRRDI